MPSAASTTARLRAVRPVTRYGVRCARRAVLRTGRHRWWTVAPDSGSGLVLRPAQVLDGDAWDRLVRRCGDRPPGQGMRASALGGSAATRAEWMRRCLELRAAAHRGEVYAYLVHRNGVLVGEALGHVDLGDATVDIVVWLAPDAGGAAVETAVVALLSRHVLSGPADVRHARILVPAQDTDRLAALTGCGFAVAGTITDPPRGPQTLLVAARPSLPRLVAA